MRGPPVPLSCFKKSLADQCLIINLAFNFWHNFRKKNTNKSWTPSPIFFREKKSERFNQFLTLKNDFENQNLPIFEALGRQNAKDLLKYESAIYHSINQRFDVEVPENVLHGI